MTDASEQVCFGMVCSVPRSLQIVGGPPNSSVNILSAETHTQIYRTSVKLIGDMSTLQTKLSAQDATQPTFNSRFMLKRDSEEILLTFEDGTELGILNVHMAKALRIAMERFQVDFDALVNTLTLDEIIARAVKAGDAIIRVNINVYGSKEEVRELGYLLSRNKVYLQHPDHQRLGSIYENPHVLGLGETYDFLKDQFIVGRRDGILESSSSEGFQEAVSAVYASLKRGTCLRRVEGNDQLKTDLLPYVVHAIYLKLTRSVY